MSFPDYYKRHVVTKKGKRGRLALNQLYKNRMKLIIQTTIIKQSADSSARTGFYSADYMF